MSDLDKSYLFRMDKEELITLLLDAQEKNERLFDIIEKIGENNKILINMITSKNPEKFAEEKLAEKQISKFE